LREEFLEVSIANKGLPYFFEKWKVGFVLRVTAFNPNGGSLEKLWLNSFIDSRLNYR